MTEASPLQVVDLEIDYGKVPAVRGVSFSLRSGEITTIIGSNGAGKSTIMKAIAGLLTPTSGEIQFHGNSIVGLTPDEIVVRGLSLVPEGRRLFASMTVRENLEIGAYRRQNVQAVKRDLGRVLEYFPAIEAKLGERAGNLSGGQQQMVAVARALMSSPKLLMLDEPTIGLAPANVEIISDIITAISKSGVDVLLVEQNAGMALDISNYAFILERGKIVIEGSSESLVSSDEVRRAYLGA
ncbi:ABC transporter ATP-binding protein [Hoeflea sp.]|uniref:ABC transporter ATP-binding protein n=1 Tax=Hoeflea sp. TaxID=1940281 RepID=UPI0019C92335|nr:ABC transporter ATP-binding protein [Hoeflea sp.]MBC7285547.1 ABC transporter ATP-binding protein [Hoeflea sp.]